MCLPVYRGDTTTGVFHRQGAFTFRGDEVHLNGLLQRLTIHHLKRSGCSVAVARGAR
jgi:hypothetical protein